jgi:hypothetical protein
VNYNESAQLLEEPTYFIHKFLIQITYNHHPMDRSSPIPTRNSRNRSKSPGSSFKNSHLILSAAHQVWVAKSPISNALSPPKTPTHRRNESVASDEELEGEAIVYTPKPPTPTIPAQQPIGTHASYVYPTSIKSEDNGKYHNVTINNHK